MKDPGEALRSVAATLLELKVPFFLGGSLASSVYGVCRATAGVDVVARLDAARVRAMLPKLAPDFYAEPETIREAVAEGVSFSLIHYATGFKIVFHPLGSDCFSRRQYRRRRMEEYPSAAGELKLPLCSPEDTILAKLLWLQQHPDSAGKHWEDARGVIEVQNAALDLRYLRKRSAELKLTALLEELLRGVRN